MADLAEDERVELEALRQRREKILRLQAERTAVATTARELLAKDSTWPRRRAEVEAELRTAEVWDLPMLAEELALADRAIEKLEASLQVAEPPLAVLAVREGLAGPLKKKRRQLQGLVRRRQVVADRVGELRREFDAAVAAMRDQGEERGRLLEAIASLDKLDREIDRLGDNVKRLERSTDTCTMPG